MRLESKYDIDDTVYFMRNNKVVAAEIRGISLYIQRAGDTGHNQKIIESVPSYTVCLPKPGGEFDRITLSEDEVYSSKSRLLDSL